MDAIDQAIEVLNRIHTSDPTVLPALIQYRVPCNEKLAEDPTVQVGRLDDQATKFEVGLLGIINGLFGIREDGWGFIAADMRNGTIARFVRLGDDGKVKDVEEVVPEWPDDSERLNKE